jgi:hypothetical protein
VAPYLSHDLSDGWPRRGQVVEEPRLQREQPGEEIGQQARVPKAEEPADVEELTRKSQILQSNTHTQADMGGPL